MKDKPGRNDPCPCGSGKKFKKCCDKKMIGNRFMASKISGATGGSTTSKLSSFFQSNISSIPSLGASGRTFTVQKGAPQKKQEVPEQPPLESTPEEKPEVSEEVIKDATETEQESTQIVEPKGPEEEPPEENDEAHS